MSETGENTNKPNKETGFNTTVYTFLKHYQQHIESTEEKDILPPYVLALNFLIERTITPKKKPELIKKELNKIVQETIKAETGQYSDIRKTESLVPTLRMAAQSLLGENKPPGKE